MASQSKRGPLIVEPTSQVFFSGPASRPSRATIKLINKTTSRIAFKVKTTAPSFYGVRPNAGVVLPHNTAEVEIARQPFTQDQITKLNHKFMVQSFVVPEGVEDVSKLWPNIDTAKLGIVKLRCVFEDAPLSREQMTKQTSQAPQATSAPQNQPSKVPQETQTSITRQFAQTTQTSLMSTPSPKPRPSPRQSIEKKPKPSQSLESIRRLLEASNYPTPTPKPTRVERADKSQQYSIDAVSQAVLVNDFDTRQSQFSQPVDKNRYSYHSHDSTSVASKMPLSPRLSPIQLPSPPTMQQKMMVMSTKEASNPREQRKQQKRKSEEIFTALQLATMNTEIHQLRTENKHLRQENNCLKQETQTRKQYHHKSPIRREYSVPHSQLPRQDVAVPICYIIASMTFALLCLIIGKFVL